MQIIALIIPWLPFTVFILPVYMLIALPFVAYGLYEKWRYNVPQASKLTPSSIPAMVMHQESLGDFMGKISEPQKRTAFTKALGVCNQLWLDIRKNPASYPENYENFIILQAQGNLKELGVAGSLESEKFLILLRKEINRMTEFKTGGQNE